MKRKSLLYMGCIFAGALMGIGAWIYQRRSKNRIPSQESLDDPAVAEAFAQVSTKPPWRLLRWYISRRASSLKDVGEAIDLGCGPGYLVLELAKRSKGLHVIGVDCSEEMLIQANANAYKSGLAGRVSFKIGNAERTPYEDHSLDLVVSTLSLHHWKNPILVMNEIVRVLRPGGGYLIFDLRRDMAAPFYVFLWLITRFVVPAPLRLANEPMGSRDAAYTPYEVTDLVSKSHLVNSVIFESPAWLLIEGKIPIRPGGKELSKKF
jgi:ubiquinone/menaquinone biosynthesis C-methylase UbiE